MKWARSRVAVSAQELPAVGGEAQRRLRIVIEDDGPGIPEDKAREALKRGKRLDETSRARGLGLAIVSELVNEYGGKLSLERSELGGLKAIVELRASTDRRFPTASRRRLVSHGIASENLFHGVRPNFGQIWHSNAKSSMRVCRDSGRSA